MPFFQNVSFEKGSECKVADLNKLVLEIKCKGFDCVEFCILYQAIYSHVEKRAHQYIHQGELRNMFIDVNDLISYAMNEYLKKSISDWNGTGSFEGFFFLYLKTGFYNAIRHLFTKKREINISFAELDREMEANGEAAPLYTFLAQPEEENEYSEQFEALLDAFEQYKGKQARQIIECFADGSKEVITSSVCAVLGVSDYDQATRQKVQRIKNQFKKFLENRHFKR